MCLLATGSAQGQTTIPASSLSHRSTGSTNGSTVTLDKNGYVGTYFTLDSAGPVTIKALASGSSPDATLPRLGISIADTLVEFDVTPSSTQYSHTYDLPAGTYFVRTQLSNSSPSAARSLSLNSLTIEGASTVSNVSTRSVNEANALSAADTYIEHYRQGGTSLAIAGASPGTPLEVRMLRNEFNFGTYVTGFNADTWLAPTGGNPNLNRAKYQDFVTQYFNMLVPSNMGKWQPNENTPGVPTMGHVDTILNFNEANNMSARMHNLIWGNQQPSWVNSLIADAQSSNPSVSDPAKAQLRQAIIDRIAYYVGDGDADVNDGDRARRYVELDVLNESLRNDVYWEIYGPQGVAEIYKLTRDAVTAAEADTRLYVNEYNVFSFANNPITGQSDNYANWYREHVEELNSQEFGQVVDGIGIQYGANPVADNSPTGGQNHNTARINQVLQNMAISGLPVTLTEFAIPEEAFGETTTAERAAEIYDETLRMMYGSPLATSMLIWEAWPTSTTDVTTIVDSNWNLTLAGQAFVNLMNQWRTPTQFLSVGPDGSVEFDGHYGEYEVVVDGEIFVIDHSKHTPVHTLVTAGFIPGDYNSDRTVDGEDFLTWQRNPALGSLADWASNYGFTEGGGRVRVVPEPSSSALSIGALLLAATGARRRRYRRLETPANDNDAIRASSCRTERLGMTNSTSLS